MTNPILLVDTYTLDCTNSWPYIARTSLPELLELPSLPELTARVALVTHELPMQYFKNVEVYAD